MNRKVYLIVSCIIITLAAPGCIVLPPDSISIKQETTNSVKISWKAKLLIAGGFTIERKSEGGNFDVIATLPMNPVVQWSYQDDALQTGIKYTYRVRSYYREQFSKYSPEAEIVLSENPPSDSFIIDHNCAKLAFIPGIWVNQAKSKLHIAYQHSSHGSQLVDGMTGLFSWKGPLYTFNNGGSGGALDLRDCEIYNHGYITGGIKAEDLGKPDRTAWAEATRNYLRDYPEVNVIIWAWCGQVYTASESDINNYLSLMNELETDYPGVKFIYMTGHVDGEDITSNLHVRNDQIRKFCRDYNKILYDFADIESYDPDGNYFGDWRLTDSCYYDRNKDWVYDGNWAIEWQNSHVEGVDWYNCGSAHSQPLNANLKAYAAWWMFARMAGWDGQ
jgi:hypothetical protein